MTILRWIDFDPEAQAQALKSIREIFFESSERKSFNSDSDRESFWNKWVQYYFDEFPEEIFLATHSLEIVGYLTGCRFSNEAQLQISENIPYFSLFSNYFDHYPAHLHVNVKAQFRGHGIGEFLISSYCQYLSENSVVGVHLLTSPGARNVNFYRRCGFDFEAELPWKSTKLLFMGKKISDERERTNFLEP